VKTFQPQRGRAFCLESDGKTAVFAGFFDTSIAVYDAKTLQETSLLHEEGGATHKDSIRALTLINPNEMWSGSLDSVMCVWNYV
jgi:WD40 repeat protein